MTTFNIFHTTRVRIGVRDAPHIWGAGEIRDAGERRLFGGLARSEPFVTPHVWGTGEMSTKISATYLGRCGNKHWKSRRIYVALGHDELNKANLRDLIAATSLVISNWIQIVNFSARVTVKFDGWPRKTIGHFFYTTSSFVHHFKSIGEFKLDLQSRNAQFRSKLVICYTRVTLKFDGWPWKTIVHLFYATSSFVQHFVAIGEFKLKIQSRNAQFGSKLRIFWAVWPRNFTDDPQKQ